MVAPAGLGGPRWQKCSPPDFPLLTGWKAVETKIKLTIIISHGRAELRGLTLSYSNFFGFIDWLEYRLISPELLSGFHIFPVLIISKGQFPTACCLFLFCKSAINKPGLMEWLVSESLQSCCLIAVLDAAITSRRLFKCANCPFLSLKFNLV